MPVIVSTIAPMDSDFTASSRIALLTDSDESRTERIALVALSAAPYNFRPTGRSLKDCMSAPSVRSGPCPGP
jgi:hypothetical protein